MSSQEQVEAAVLAVALAHDRIEYNTDGDYAAMDDALMQLRRALSLPTPLAADAAREAFVVKAREYASRGTEEHRLWMMTAYRRLLAAEQEKEARDGE